MTVNGIKLTHIQKHAELCSESIVHWLLSVRDEGEWDEILWYELEWGGMKAVINLSCILSI